MTKLRHQMTQDLKLAGLSPGMQAAYLRSIRARSPLDLLPPSH